MELLVVIAIIGVLASMILVSLAAEKKKVQQTQCLNNVRQLGFALQEFVSDNHV